MTQDETEASLGAESPPHPLSTSLPMRRRIAPGQDGGAAATARARDALAGAEFAPLDLAELLTLDIPERGMVLDPIIPEKGLALLYAMRGTGKTHVALGIAHAVATGGAFLNWRAPQPRRVLLVDGEMPASDLRGRLQSIVAGTGVAAAPGMLKVLAGDLLEDGVGDLADPQVQRKARALSRRRRAAHPRQPGEPHARAARKRHRRLDDDAAVAAAAAPARHLGARRASCRQERRAARRQQSRGPARYLDQPAAPERLQPGRRRALRGPRRQGPRAARRAGAAVRGDARNRGRTRRPGP